MAELLEEAKETVPAGTPDRLPERVSMNTAKARPKTHGKPFGELQKRPRIQLDLPAETYAGLEALAEKTGAGSVNEFTKSALRFYRWHLECKAKGYQLMLEKDGKAATVELVF